MTSPDRAPTDAGNVSHEHCPSPPPRRAVSDDARQEHVAYIDARAFLGAAVVEALAARSDLTFRHHRTLEGWSADPVRPHCRMLLAHLGSMARPGSGDGLAAVVAAADRVPVVVLADTDDGDQAVAALKRGVRGFVPTSLDPDIVVQALRLVMAGGVYAPMTSLLGDRSSERSDRAEPSGGLGRLTIRQRAVVEALRKGKSNKAIAHELNMCESTVKVHVRNVMKRLNAKNRTEVAFLSSEFTRAVHRSGF